MWEDETQGEEGARQGSQKCTGPARLHHALAFKAFCLLARCPGSAHALICTYRVFRRSLGCTRWGCCRACVSSSHQIPRGVGRVSCGGAGGSIEWEDRSPIHSGWLLGDMDEAVCDSDRSQREGEDKCGHQRRFRPAQSPQR